MNFIRFAFRKQIFTKKTQNVVVIDKFLCFVGLPMMATLHYLMYLEFYVNNTYYKKIIK